MRVPILMYHEVTGPDGMPEESYASWSVTREQFADHLDMLSSRGYTGMSVSQWLDAREALPRGVKPVVITFDDGFTGNLDSAIPALLERGWSATFFLISMKIGAPGYGSAKGWQDAAQAGMEIGSHTATHPFMGPVSAADARRELQESKTALEKVTLAPIRGFSWPNGDDRPDGKSMLLETGYAWAATSRAAFADATTDVFDLPRLPIRSWHHASGLESLINSGLRNRLRMAAFFHAKRVFRKTLGRDAYARFQRTVRGDDSS